MDSCPSEKCFTELQLAAIVDKTFEINSSFHAK